MKSILIENLEKFNKDLNIAKYIEYFFDYGDSVSKEDLETKIFYCHVMAINSDKKNRNSFAKQQKTISELKRKGTLNEFYHKNIKPQYFNNDDWFTAYKSISIISSWLRYKQIYKFDNDAYKMILDTEPKDITFQELKALKLPYECFGVENELQFKEFHISSFFIEKFFNEKDNTIELNVGMFFDKPNGISTINITLKENETLLEGCPKEALETIKKVQNILLYLAQPKIDIIRKSVVKNNPDKKEIPKHFYNIEYNNDEIGCKLGNAIRNYRYIYEKKTNNSNKEKRIVKPHIRCGHFQGYWIGKGRTEYITKYIEPIFVLGGSKDAILHKVEG